MNQPSHFRGQFTVVVADIGEVYHTQNRDKALTVYGELTYHSVSDPLSLWSMSEIHLYYEGRRIA